MMKPNFLLLTVDDMNYNSRDFVKESDRRKELMPCVDKLMSEGITLKNSHVAIAICQPSRSCLMTGLYPHKNGARGFEDIRKDVRTLTQILKEHGYYNGIVGKVNHISPKEQFCWDMYEATYNDERSYGRYPGDYYEITKGFLRKAKENGAPFFLMANSHDPHRPFAGSEDEKKMFDRQFSYTKVFEADDVKVPDSLPDLPEIRTEISQYLNSVHRADQTVGEILRALREEGLEDNTMVMFLSDNGMSIPFAKANCYLNSTKSPYVIRWKGHINPGTVSEALVSSIDYMPSVLEAAGIECPDGLDGKSFCHLFDEPDGEQYKDIYTCFYKTAKNQVTKKELFFQMRCVQDDRFAYIYNNWSDGEASYRTESMAGMTYAAMEKAAETDPEIAERVEFLKHRVKEELYDFQSDPQALKNLIADPEFDSIKNRLKARMETYMRESNDELLGCFLNEV